MIRLILFLSFWFLPLFGSLNADNKPDDSFRLVWAGNMNLNLDLSMQRVKNSGFNSIAVCGNNVNIIIAYAQKKNIAVYYWFHIITGDKMQQFSQQMKSEEKKQKDELDRDGSKDKGGYQFGYEPLKDHSEVLNVSLMCFHRQETVDYCKKHLRIVLERFPELSGIAFDFIGYQNYHGCYCEESLRQYKVYLESKGKTADDNSFAQISLEALVNFYNQMADYSREIKPGTKTAAVTYPVFLPEPLYGNRLNVDYCCQPVAGTYPPFWSAEKITRYTRIVIEKEKQFFPRPRGIPFVGVYQNNPALRKDDDEFSKELQIIKQATGDRKDLSVCPYQTFATSPEPGKIILREFGLE
jgi:hypothetical protein